MKKKYFLDSEFRKREFLHGMFFSILVFNVVRFFSPGVVFPLWESELSRLSWVCINVYTVVSLIQCVVSFAYYLISEKYIVHLLFPFIPVKIIHFPKVVEIGCGKVDARIGVCKIYFAVRELTEYEKNNLDSLPFGIVRYIPYREKVYDYLHDVLKLKMGDKNGFEWR
ncbi:MAG: hypothetical protein IKM61_02135 [Eubacteriaceae bacterium]|nr:hypothetical protein [Eubacteriaceae bacterium]